MGVNLGVRRAAQTRGQALASSWASVAPNEMDDGGDAVGPTALPRFL